MLTGDFENMAERVGFSEAPADRLFAFNAMPKPKSLPMFIVYHIWNMRRTRNFN